MRQLLLGVMLLAGGCRPKLCSIEGAWRKTGNGKIVNYIFENGMITWDDGDGQVHTGSYSPRDGYFQIDVSCDSSSFNDHFDGVCDDSGQALYLGPSEFSSATCGVLLRQSTAPTMGVVCSSSGTGCSCKPGLVTQAPSTCDETTPDSNALCCADYAWPSSGECTCLPVLCDDSVSAPGTCAYCEPTTSSTKYPIGVACVGSSVCCYSSSYDWCECYSGNTICPTGYATVSSCLTPKYKCPSGTTKVTSCSSP